MWTAESWTTCWRGWTSGWLSRVSEDTAAAAAVTWSLETSFRGHQERDKYQVTFDPVWQCLKVEVTEIQKFGANARNTETLVDMLSPNLVANMFVNITGLRSTRNDEDIGQHCRTLWHLWSSTHQHLACWSTAFRGKKGTYQLVGIWNIAIHSLLYHSMGLWVWVWQKII